MAVVITLFFHIVYVFVADNCSLLLNKKAKTIILALYRSSALVF